MAVAIIPVQEDEGFPRFSRLMCLGDMQTIFQAPIILFCVFTLLPVSFVLGKIGDPRPLIVGHIRYESHQHTVSATDVGKNKVLWKTKIPMAFYRGDVDRRLERDIQWNIINSLEIKGKLLFVTNSKRETFKLDSVTGKLVKQAVSE